MLFPMLLTYIIQYIAQISPLIKSANQCNNSLERSFFVMLIPLNFEGLVFFLLLIDHIRLFSTAPCMRRDFQA